MEYSDIMEEQKDRLRAELKWWPNFFYHFTDVHNVVNILRSGWIMSRERGCVVILCGISFVFRSVLME